MCEFNDYFQRMPLVDRDKLKVNAVCLYSMTPWREANYISRMILNFYGGWNRRLEPLYGDKPIITDATANCGGNTISFNLSGGFKRVNAAEIDKAIFDMLRNNLEVYSIPLDNLWCCDYLEVHKTLQQDVVFIDCPWGGPDYIKSPSLDLFLSGVNVTDICKVLFENRLVSLVVLKVPINYNSTKLYETLPTKKILIHKIYRGIHHSYSIIFCWEH
jgi:predicted RNA methylase